jgi:peroxiredoxin
MNSLILAILGFIISFGGIVLYFRTIPRNKVPENPIVLQLPVIIGMVLVISALITGIPGSLLSVTGIIILSIIPILLGSFILWVLTQRKTPLGNIKVNVGDNILPFELKTSDEKSFNTRQLAGKRTLLKFFRWAWCPYCSAEIKMFNDMKTDLDNYKIQIVALSGDSLEEVNVHKERDGIDFTLLANPDLSIIKQYGVEHHKALGADSKDIAFSIGGIPFATKFKFKSMSIPTSILIDENWVIQWIDQSADYRLRSSKKAVMGAVKKTFGN